MKFTRTLPWPDWEIAGVLGTGGFGAVYEIHRGSEKAAVKILSIPRDDDEITQLRAEGYDEASISAHYRDTLKDILQEYALMVEVKGNTNVVACEELRYTPHENGIGWDIFIKMELLKPLNKTMSPQYRESDVIRLGRDLCNALILCRQKGIVHRDIKPANIFISSNGDYKLGDFGIAKYSDRTTQGTRIGTYEFMAPEVYNNRPYGTAADIYCLGLVLYWMMNERRTPFLPLPPQIPSSSEREKAGYLRYSGHPLPAPANGSDALKRIVLRACAFAPEMRYSSAEEFAQDLARLEYASSTVVRPETRAHEFDDVFTGNTGTNPGWQPQQTQPPRGMPMQGQTSPRPQMPPQPRPVQQTYPQGVTMNQDGVRPVQQTYPQGVTMTQNGVRPVQKKKSSMAPLWIVLGIVAGSLLMGAVVMIIAGIVAPKNGWVTENGEKYYYVDDVYLTGWHTVEGSRRYFNADGTLPDSMPQSPSVKHYVTGEEFNKETDTGITWNGTYSRLERQIYDCVALDFSIFITESNVNCDGKWVLYVRDYYTGNWKVMGTFWMEDGAAYERFYLNTPITFDAFTCVFMEVPEGASIGWEYDITNVQRVVND